MLTQPSVTATPVNKMLFLHEPLAQVAQVRSLVEQQWASALDDATVRRFVRATGGNLALVSSLGSWGSGLSFLAWAMFKAKPSLAYCELSTYQLCPPS